MCAYAALPFTNKTAHLQPFLVSEISFVFFFFLRGLPLRFANGNGLQKDRPFTIIIIMLHTLSIFPWIAPAAVLHVYIFCFDSPIL